MTIVTTTTPRAAAAAQHLSLPAGDDERVVGFGVMGLPFASGHYLAYRDFSASSFSPAYRSVWHRDPEGLWTFYATTPGPLSCSRYFSSATPVDAVQCDITARWSTPFSLTISIESVLHWDINMAATPATRVMSTIGARLPSAAWNSRLMLSLIGGVAGPMLGVGKVRLAGLTPNGQRFRVAPKRLWALSASTATILGHHVGPVGALPHQAQLADFRLPQRGICVVGHGSFSASSIIGLPQL
jgi:hypothetical protein